MSTASTLTLREALADPALRESLLVSSVMLVASGGLTLLLAWFWVLYRAARAGEPPAVEWLIVCGHVLEEGRPSRVYRERLQRAGRMAREEPGLRLLLAGGGQPSEAAVGRDWLSAEFGVDTVRIQLEEISTDTFENLRHARCLLPPDARLGIVTSRFHVARVMAYAHQLDLNAVPVPAEARWQFDPGNLGASLREAAFLCWFACGRFWARHARRRHLLDRLE